MTKLPKDIEEWIEKEWPYDPKIRRIGPVNVNDANLIEASGARAMALKMLEREKELVDALDGLLNKANRVTSPHRHGRSASHLCLDELSNRQIEVDWILAKYRTPKEPKPNE